MTESPTTAPVDTVPVALGERSYDILVGANLLADDVSAEAIAEHLTRPKTVIVTDETVGPRHGATLRLKLDAAGIKAEVISLPPGEATKSFEWLQKLLSDLLDLGVERSDTIVALGGGVIGDLTGFAASILRRGISYIQVPTTLLAQVDSAVGGKTGINVPQGKNLIGSFHQPKLVVSDVSTLATLDTRQFLAGYAEVVKYALIDDPDFFDWLEEHGPALVAGDAELRRRAVVQCCKAKARIVAADEREAGQRALLNLGHTFGHALEAETGYSDTLLHGEGVAIGMVLAFALSARLGLCPAEDGDRVKAHLDAVGLPTSPKSLGSLSADTLLTHMAQDKKMKGGRLTLILTRGIGRAFATADVPPEEIEAVLHSALQ